MEYSSCTESNFCNIKRTYNSLLMNSRLKVRCLASRLTAPKHLAQDREGERGRTREKGNEQGPLASISLTGTERKGGEKEAGGTETYTKKRRYSMTGRRESGYDKERHECCREARSVTVISPTSLAHYHARAHTNQASDFVNRQDTRRTPRRIIHPVPYLPPPRLLAVALVHTCWGAPSSSLLGLPPIASASVSIRRR
jgi:hypothetical protein